MAGYGVKEARIDRQRHTQVNLCGSCAKEITASELLCADCLLEPEQESTFDYDYN